MKAIFNVCHSFSDMPIVCHIQVKQSNMGMDGTTLETGAAAAPALPPASAHPNRSLRQNMPLFPLTLNDP